MLIVPRKRIWTQQPQSPAEVDFSRLFNSGRGIRSIRRFQSGASSVATNALTATGTLPSAVIGSLYGTDFATGDYAGTQPFVYASSGVEAESYTVAFVLSKRSTTTNSIWVGSSTRAGAIAGAPYLRGSIVASNTLSIYKSVSGGTIVPFTPTVFVIVYRGVGGSYAIYQDGKLVAEDGGGNWWIGVSTDVIVYGNGYFGGGNHIMPLMIEQQARWSAEYIREWSSNPWQIFHSPDSRIFVPTGSGAPAGAILAGNAQAQATATGNLTLKADLDAVALSVATASGNLTTFIPLTGAAVAIGAASGALTSSIKLSAAAMASALASGSLVAQIKLNGAALAQAAASAGLTSAILLAGSGQGQATASGTLAADPGSMAGNTQAQATAVATLTTSIRLSGAAAAQAGVSGILTTNISLTAAALAQAIATGTLAVPILLAGAAHGVATATGNLTAPDSATAVYFRLASSVQRLTKAACTAQRLTTIKHEVQHV